MAKDPASTLEIPSPRLTFVSDLDTPDNEHDRRPLWWISFQCVAQQSRSCKICSRTQKNGPNLTLRLLGGRPNTLQIQTYLFLALTSSTFGTHSFLVLDGDVAWYRCKRSWQKMCMGTKPLEVEDNYNLFLGLGCHYLIEQQLKK